MAAEVPGIGSKASPQFQTVKEQYQLPGSRKEVVQAIASLLDKGGVQKLTVQVGQPLRVERLVKAGEVAPEMEVLDDDIYFAARNADLRDFETSDITPERAVLNAFRYAREGHAVPSVFICHKKETFALWLGLRKADPMADVYGLDVIEHKDVPEDVLLFVCMKAEEQDSIAFSLKILMEE